VIERQGSRENEHFTEGELDLEPPEELAVLEVDDEALLEEDLDNQVDLEDEVDEEILETSLDHLVHDGDDEDVIDDGDGPGPAHSPAPTLAAAADDPTDVDDLEIEDLEDRMESLDKILREKLAGDEEPGVDLDGLGTDGAHDAEAVEVPSCGPDEFVCPSCFLVRNLAQRVDGSGSLCHDCSE